MIPNIIQKRKLNITEDISVRKLGFKGRPWRLYSIFGITMVVSLWTHLLRKSQLQQKSTFVVFFARDWAHLQVQGCDNWFNWLIFTSITIFFVLFTGNSRIIPSFCCLSGQQCACDWLTFFWKLHIFLLHYTHKLHSQSLFMISPVKARIKTAQRRVVMASLYLGTGQLEQELVRWSIFS